MATLGGSSKENGSPRVVSLVTRVWVLLSLLLLLPAGNPEDLRTLWKQLANRPVSYQLSIIFTSLLAHISYLQYVALACI